MTRDEAIKGEVNTKEGVRGARYSGPNLLLLTLIYLGLLIAGGSKLSAAVAMPHDSAEKALAFMTLARPDYTTWLFFRTDIGNPVGHVRRDNRKPDAFPRIECFGRSHSVPRRDQCNAPVDACGSHQLVPHAPRHP